MKTRDLVKFGVALLMTSSLSVADEHKWAGKTFNDLEWRIHEELAGLPFHEVFDDLRFELNDRAVTLSGNVVRESVKVNAERAVKRLDGVASVINRIEVLPHSKTDDQIRMRVYRSIYESRSLERYGIRGSPQIQIIVKNGAVTLEGFVDSESDRRLVYHQASRVARPVTTNLRVEPREESE